MQTCKRGTRGQRTRRETRHVARRCRCRRPIYDDRGDCDDERRTRTGKGQAVGRDATSCQTRIGTSHSLGCKGKFCTLLWSSRLLSRCCHVYLQHGLMPYPRGATIVARYGKQASGGPRFSSSQSTVKDDAFRANRQIGTTHAAARMQLLVVWRVSYVYEAWCFGAISKKLTFV